ncbi:MAG: hypothetical protein E6Q40_09090, partial [Cupriavidus sp.]
MSRNAEIIVSRQGKLLGKAVRIDSTSPAKIKAVPGARYVLKEADSDVSPENVTVRRVGDDLQVMLEGEDAPALTLEGYYALSEPSGLYGIAEDAGLYAYVPTDASTGFLALPDGQMTPLALGGEPLGPAESLIPTQSESTGLWGMPPWLLLAGAGAAIAGTVVAATSGGSGSKTPAPAPVNPQALDQVGPVQGVLTNGDVSDDTRPVITGTGIAGYTITVYDGEQVIGTTVVGADGIWRFQPEAPLGDGEHHLAVTQAGPDAPPSVPVPVVDVAIDSVPPATPAATIAGTVDGLTTNDTRPTINGTGEPGDRITVTFPGGESKTTTVAADGTWSVKADTALPDGPQDIVVSEQDPAGNTTTMTMPAVVDTEAPPTPLIDGMTVDVAPVTGPVPNGGQTNDTTPTLAGVAEPGSTIKVYDNEELIGTVTADGQGAWSFTPAQPLAEGDHAIEVTATDRAGNTSEAASYAVTVDTSAPPKPAGPLGLDQVLDDVGPIQGPIAANGVTDDRRPTFTGFGTAGETVTVYDNGQAIGRATVAANGQWSLTPSADLAEGQHRITTTALNPLGQTSDPTPAWQLSVDLNPPLGGTSTVDLVDASDWGVSNKDNITGDATPHIVGKVVAPGETLNKLSVTLYADMNGDNRAGPEDMILSPLISVQADGSWETDLSSLKLGTYALRALLVDEAGNRQVANAGGLLSATGTPNSPLVIETGGSMTYTGAKPGDALGWEISDIGDFNGDGYSDILVTAPLMDTNKADSGGGYIVYGSASGLVRVPSVSQLTQKTGLIIKGHTYPNDNIPQDQTGRTGNRIGDFNRDGYADIVLSCHWNDKSYVIFGAPSSSFTNGVLDLTTMDGGDKGTNPIDNSHGFLIAESPLTDDTGIGYSVGGADINGDGYVDLMISNLSGPAAGGGQVLVVYGGANANASTSGWKNIYFKQTSGVGMSGSRDYRPVDSSLKYTVINGFDGRNVAGNGVKNTSIASHILGVGDVNGDGIEDFVLVDGTEDSSLRVQTNPLATGGGTIYLFYGRAGGLPTTFNLKDFKNGVDGVRIHSMLDDRLGTETEAHVTVAGLDDINGDGIDDFAIGSPFLLGRVWVIYGKAGGHGSSDMYLDVAVPKDGKNYFPRAPGHVTSFTANDGFVILNTASTVANPVRSAERFGYSVRSAGDLNGDGISDFVIGAPYSSTTAGSYAGAYYVVYGTGANQSSPVLAIKDIIADPTKGYVVSGKTAN